MAPGGRVLMLLTEMPLALAVPLAAMPAVLDQARHRRSARKLIAVVPAEMRRRHHDCHGCELAGDAATRIADDDEIMLPLSVVVVAAMFNVGVAVPEYSVPSVKSVAPYTIGWLSEGCRRFQCCD